MFKLRFRFFLNKMTFGMLILSAQSAFASDSYISYYCPPPPNETSVNSCYSAIMSALQPSNNELVKAVVTHMANFDDLDIANAILTNRPSLISLATNASNFAQDNYEAVMDKFIDYGYPYKGFVGLKSEDGKTVGSFHRKITTVLRKRSSDDYYELIVIAGSYNFNGKSKSLNLEEIYVETWDWAARQTESYNEMKQYLIDSIINQYPTLGERQLVLNKIAQTNTAKSNYVSYLSTCDFYLSGYMLNEVNLALCSD